MKKTIKIIAAVLALTLSFTSLHIVVFAEEAKTQEQLTDAAELWQPTESESPLSHEGDLSPEELTTAELAPEDIPEMISEEEIQENEHVHRLRAQEEDLNSVVFQNRDGTKTMYYFTQPVKYEDENGEIKDKKNTIIETDDGDFTNTENDIQVYFPKKLHKNKGVELQFGEFNIELSPDINGNSGASRQTGHNKNYDPTEYVQYPDVFGEGIAVRYTPTFEGYKEDIILEEYTGLNQFTFRLRTNGLSLIEKEDGTYDLVEPLSGETLAEIGELYIYDSKPIETPEETIEESVSNPTDEDYAKRVGKASRSKSNQ